MRKLPGALYCALLVFGAFFAPVTNAASPTLEEALDAALTWTASGTPTWSGQTTVTHDGIDAAGSGTIADGSTATMSATLNGPGTASFWWKISSETNNDRLVFFVNGIEQARISGEVDWQLKSFVLASGSQTLTWTYSKNASLTAGQDHAWVDQVSFGPSCDYSISPTMRNHGHGAASNTVTVSVQTNCAWSVSNTNSWITILGGGSGMSGTGSVTYAVSANTGINGRTGVVMIAGQPFTIQQSAVPCTISLNPGMRNHGYAVANNSFTVQAGTNCAWSVVNTSLWITLTGRTSGSGTNTVPYSVSRNLTPIQRTGNVMIADQKFVLSQNAAPCLYELSPTNRVHGHAGSTGLVTVTTTANCAWFVQNTNDWITITVHSNGQASGTFGYVVAPNPVSAPRNGTFKVWDEVFTVFQHPASCSYSISPSSSSTDADSRTNLVAVTATGGCSWSVVNTNPWISVSPTSGVGDEALTLIIAANPGSLGRTGVVSISNQFYTVRQSGAVCSYQLSPTNRIHGNGMATNTVRLDTVSICPWSVVNTNTWITILSPTNGVGDAEITYAISLNSDVDDRVGVILIGGEAFVLTQRGAGCTINLSPATRNHGRGAATNSLDISAAPTCAWEVVNTNSWITILSGASGTGAGAVYYAVQPNSLSPFPRTGNLVVKDKVCTITQDGITCSYSVTPETRTHGYGAASNSFTVTTTNGCSWSVGNTNTWISIAAGASGAASDTVSYVVEANPELTERVGILTVDGQTFTITQRAFVCTFALSPANRNHGYGATNGTVNVSAAPACGWVVSNTNSWITILSSPSGAGEGSVTYEIAANTDLAARSGTVWIGDAPFMVNQAAYLCSYRLSPTNRMHGPGANTNTVNITAAPGCPWSVVNTNTWITLRSSPSGSGDATVTYEVDANLEVAPRSGNILIGDESFTVMQSGYVCSYRLSPTNRPHGFAGSTNTVSVNTGPNCAWTVVNTNPWISILSSANGTGTGTVTYVVASNSDVAPRSGNLLIADETFAVTQSGYLCTYKLSPATRTHGFGANTNSVNITAGPTCAWTVVNTNDWITIVSGTSGTGNSNFVYTISPNYGTATRTGYVAMADQVLTLMQSASTGGFVFESMTMNTSGELVLKLNGGPPGIWEIQTTSNLVNWIKVATITNTTGKVEFIAPSTASEKRFYRAILP